jgi:hypothetical protein
MGVDEYLIGLPFLGQRIQSIDSYLHRKVPVAYGKIVDDRGLHLTIATDSFEDGAVNRRIRLSRLDSSAPEIMYWLQPHHSQPIRLRGRLIRDIPPLDRLSDKDCYIQAARDLMADLRGILGFEPYKVRMENNLDARMVQDSDALINLRVDDVLRLQVHLDGYLHSIDEHNDALDARNVIYSAVYMLTSKRQLGLYANSGNGYPACLKGTAQKALELYS